MIKSKSFSVFVLVAFITFAFVPVCTYGNEAIADATDFPVIAGNFSFLNVTDACTASYVRTDAAEMQDSEKLVTICADYIYNSSGTPPKKNPDISGTPMTKRKSIETIEYKKVPIDDAYSRDILQDINVSDSALEAFSRFGAWLEKEGIDAEAENINIMYIDDDLRNIDGYWVFAARPESREHYTEIIRDAKTKDNSADETVAFLNEFDQKYPVKYVRTGLALFVTVENKDELLSELTDDDRNMLSNISDVVLDDSFTKRNKKIVSNWGSSNPDVHGDMSGWAAEYAGFNSSQITIISDNAGYPDFMYPSYDIYHTNYQHYYNPSTGFGGAIGRITYYYDNIDSENTTHNKSKSLSYASHYLADMSMPLHTKYAIEQTTFYIESNHIYHANQQQPHFAYESDYVGANWTTGYNFSRYAKNVTYGYNLYDLENDSKNLSAYANFYADDAWAAGSILANNSSYVPSSSVRYATGFCLDEGQTYLNGLMNMGYQKIYDV